MFRPPCCCLLLLLAVFSSHLAADVSAAELVAASSALPSSHNVLMIIVDDLRVELNLPYGRSEVKTPNLNAFVTNSDMPGLVFDHAYANIAICCPSRTSFLLGRSPDATGQYTNGQQMRSLPGGQSWITLPQLFKPLGYSVLGGGKIYQLGHDDPDSWTGYFYPNQDQAKGCSGDPNSRNINNLQGAPVLPADVLCSTSNIAATFDYQLAERAMNALESVANSKFFLAVGFFKPHMPLHVCFFVL